MNATILTLIGYISWIMLLLLALAAYRTTFSKMQKRESLVFKADGTDLDDLGHRLTRAHLNCIECFPFIGGVLLLALATDSSSITNGLAFVVLGARLLQSGVHIVSIANAAISIRFVLFLIQFGICAYWIVKLLAKFI